MKTIAIIGGMGPQASLFAQKKIIEELEKRDIKANTVHISLSIDEFFDEEPKLNLAKEQKSLLKNIKADTGIIACNTAHIFFDDFQKLVSFPLVSLVNEVELSSDSTIVCSPTSRSIKIFGSDVHYLNDDESKMIGEVIRNINQSKKHVKLSKIVKNKKDLVFACSEISMLADQEGIDGTDTLKLAVDKVVNTL